MAKSRNRYNKHKAFVLIDDLGFYVHSTDSNVVHFTDSKDIALQFAGKLALDAALQKLERIYPDRVFTSEEV